MKRTPLKPRTIPLARGAGLTRTASLPRQRRQERRNPTKVPTDTRQAVSGRSRGDCEARVPLVCTGLATDLHHRQRRRDGGHAPVNCLDLCRADHAWIHAHPVIAREHGWIVSAFGDPATTPVTVRGRRVLLEADGYREMPA